METEGEDFNQMMWLWKLQVCLLAVQVARVKRLVQKRAYFRRARPVGRKWTRLYNTEEQREQHSFYNTLLLEAAMADHYTFFNATRMSSTTFEVLSQKLGAIEWLKRSDTKMRKCIPLGIF